jgi:predicted amidohydrolase YtcJ
MAVHHALAADLLLINGRVLTMDVHDSVAQAVAVRDGKIVAVGANAEVEPLAGSSTQVIDQPFPLIAMEPLLTCLS